MSFEEISLSISLSVLISISFAKWTEVIIDLLLLRRKGKNTQLGNIDSNSAWEVTSPSIVGSRMLGLVLS